ncbi:YkvA family protein [Pseudomonas solani]|uniref:YkvA family protein n=1 Tax=Pseudomonas solani TaxID=2731552 RepID=UPI003F4ADDE6
MKLPPNLERYLPIARRFLARGRLPALLLAVTRKSAKQSGRLGAVKDDLQVLLALCVARLRGQYCDISPKALLSIVAGLVYFLTPVDAIPDWVLGVGLIDDLGVLAWVLKTWSAEIDAFRHWREAQTPEVSASLERIPVREEVIDEVL